jgi:hypothetical protein
MSQTTAPLRDEPIRDEPLRAESRDLVPAPGRGLVPASRPVGSPQPGLAGAGASIIAWGEIVLLGFLAIVGAFFASANAGPGDYGCGMILILAAVALAFLRLKARLDDRSNGGRPGDWAGALLVDDWANLTVIIVVFVLLGLAGLFLAASYEQGGLHNGGIALFVVSGAAVFLNLKHVFDNYERHMNDHRH